MRPLFLRKGSSKKMLRKSKAEVKEEVGKENRFLENSEKFASTSELRDVNGGETFIPRVRKFGKAGAVTVGNDGTPGAGVQ